MCWLTLVFAKKNWHCTFVQKPFCVPESIDRRRTGAVLPKCVAALDERRDLLVARHGKIQVWQLWIDAALSAAFFLFIIYFFANLCGEANAQNRSRRGFDLGRNILVTLPSRQRVLVCASVHTSLSTAVGCIIFRDKMQFYSPAIVSSVLSLFKKLKKKENPTGIWSVLK